MQKLLDIQREESLDVFLCASMLAVRAAGKVMGWSAVQVLLLKRLGFETLPYSFVLFALIGMVGSFIYVAFADFVRRDSLLRIYSALTGFAFMLAVFFIPSADQPIDGTFFIAAVMVMAAYGLGDATIGLQIWTMINDLFRPSQGVRVYPIIATSHLIGGILGGLSLQFFSTVCPLDTEILVFFWGLSTVLVIPVSYYLKRSHAHPSEKGRAASFKPWWEHVKDGYRFSFSSPLVYCIAGICILFWTVASLKEYQYARVIDTVIPTEARLNEYYGYYNIILNVSVLIFQVFFTGKIIQRIGVGVGLCALPFTIFLGLGSFCFSYSFLTAFSMRFGWDMVAMTIQGSSYQLAFNAVPAPYRGRARGLLDGIVNPLGGVLGGVIIISMRQWESAEVLSGARLGEHWALITLIGLFFSLLWLAVGILFKRQYYRAILQNLKSKDARTYQDSLEMVAEVKRQWNFKKMAVEKWSRFFVSHTPVRKQLQREIFGHNHLTLYWEEGLGCHKASLSMGDASLEVERREELLVFRQQGQEIKRMVFDPSGLFYWKDERGYVAFFCGRESIRKVEVGDYKKRKVFSIQGDCKKGEHVFELRELGREVDPFLKFSVEIEPSGAPLVRI